MVDIKFEVNGNDVSDSINSHLSSLEITDKDGTKSDSCTIIVSTEAKRPSYKDVIKIWINGVFYGAFSVQRTKTNNFKELTITATGVNFTGNLKVKKSRSFKSTTLGSIAEKIAGEHGLNVKANFKDVNIEHIIQEKESDLHFLDRLSKEHDAVFSIKNNTLLFIDRNETLPSFTIDLNMCASWEISHTDKMEYSSCVASWRDTKENVNKSVSVGSGTPVLKYQGSFTGEEDALRQATAKFQRANRGTKEGTLTKEGEYISAGSKINIINSAQDDGRYTVETVSTTIDGSGWKVSIDFKN